MLAAVAVGKQKRRRVGHATSVPNKRVRLDRDPANRKRDGSGKLDFADAVETIHADPDTSRQEPASSSSTESDRQGQRRTPQSSTDSIECTIQFWAHEIGFVRFRMLHHATLATLKQKVAQRTFGGVKVSIARCIMVLFCDCYVLFSCHCGSASLVVGCNVCESLKE